MREFLALFFVFSLRLALASPFLSFALAEVIPTDPVPVPAAVDLTPILQVVIGLATMLITSYIIPWLRRRKPMDYARIDVCHAAEKLLGQREPAVIGKYFALTTLQ